MLVPGFEHHPRGLGSQHSDNAPIRLSHSRRRRNHHLPGRPIPPRPQRRGGARRRSQPSVCTGHGAAAGRFQRGRRPHRRRDRAAHPRPLYRPFRAAGRSSARPKRSALPRTGRLYVAAAGAGVGVDDSSEWHNRNPDVLRFSMRAPGDFIEAVQGIPGGPHGADPDEMKGVTRLATGNSRRAVDGRPAGTQRHSQLAVGHVAQHPGSHHR